MTADSTFVPIMGARYRVVDSHGAEAVLFVNGPPVKDAAGTRYVFCQAEELHGHGCDWAGLTHPEPVVIEALAWTLVSLPGEGA